MTAVKNQPSLEDEVTKVVTSVVKLLAQEVSEVKKDRRNHREVTQFHDMLRCRLAKSLELVCRPEAF